MKKSLIKDFRSYFRDRSMYHMTSFDDRLRSGNLNPTATISPYIVKEAELNMTQQDVFSHLLENRIIFFGDEFCSETCNVAMAEVLFLNQEGDRDISFYINSPGGSVIDLLGLLGTIKAVSNDVSTVCVGMAASCANVLLTSGTKGKRKSLALSKLLCHQPSGGTNGQQTDIQIEADFIRELKEDICNIYMESTGLNHDEIWRRMDRDNWVRPERALPTSKGGDWGPLGMIDEVITKI